MSEGVSSGVNCSAEGLNFVEDLCSVVNVHSVDAHFVGDEQFVGNVGLAVGSHFVGEYGSDGTASLVGNAY